MISAAGGDREAIESRDRHTLPQRLPMNLLVFRSLRRWYWTSALRVLVIESRNLVHRIQWALEIRSWALRGYVAPLPTVWGSEPVGLLSRYRQPYICHMRTLQERHPFLSSVDLSLLGRSWKDGWECGAREGTSQSQPQSCSFDNSVGGDSMPPLTVQQPTKRDRSSPPPSRV
jgi:hypothetical protein